MAKAESIEEVRQAWEKALGVELTSEDARQIIGNVGKLYDVLDRLDKKRLARENAESSGQ